jgi:flavin-dependent dehydrogenase
MFPGTQRYSDVVILGGGPAGAATAILLSQRGISATILEAGNYSRHAMGQTLSPALNPLLAQLGIDLGLSRPILPSCRGIASAWGSKVVHQNEYFWTPYGNSWHVQRPNLDRDLARVATAAGAELLCDTRIHSCSSEPRRKWSLQIQSGDGHRRIECQFLVDASGRAGCTPLSGLTRPSVYDRLVGITWIGESRGTRPYTVIETVSHGWFYANAMPDSRCTVVLMTDSDICRGNRNQQRTFWHRQFRQAKYIREAFPESRESRPQHIFSAATVLRTPANGTNWLYVGDAALGFDPVSGQGVYQALRGAWHAATAIQDHFRTGTRQPSYDAWVRHSFGQYLPVCRKYYASERRWPTSLFWQRRQSIGD